tara:strand:- start:5241 stop:5444 length:204 start_codon:yes stop_codon:yes gene_type:complete
MPITNEIFEAFRLKERIKKQAIDSTAKDELIDLYYHRVNAMLKRIEYLESEIKLCKTQIENYEKIKN